MRILLVVFLAFILAACASRPPASDPEALRAYEEANDPIEPFNRGVFTFNQFIQKAIIFPIAHGYNAVLPEPAQDGVINALNNLNTPLTFINDVAQGEGKRALTSLGRFLINTTVGIGGLFDVASDMGLKHHAEDFSQTLGSYGVRESFYLVLPLVGPSSGRDAFGLAVDILSNPVRWLTNDEVPNSVNYGRIGLEVVARTAQNVARIEAMEESSVDYYAALRTLWRTNRNLAIENETGDKPPELPDFYFEDDEGAADE